MKTFSYSYQDSQGLRHEGEIRAASKDDAFAELRAKGIRPVRVTERIIPIVRRGIRGLRKRDITLIAAGTLLLVGAAVVVARFDGDAEQNGLALPRQVTQMPDEGELAILFPNASHRALARYAVPGRKVGQISGIDMAAVCEPIILSKDDASDVVLLKRIVIGLQQEAKRFVGQKDASARFKAFLDERQNMEALRFSDTLKRVAAKELTFDEANQILRGMGLQNDE